MITVWITVLLFGVVAAVPLDSYLTLSIHVHNVQMKVNPCLSPAVSGLSDHGSAAIYRCNIAFRFCLGTLQATKGCQYGEFIATYSVLQDAATQGFFLVGPHGPPFPMNVTFNFLPKLLFDMRVEVLHNSHKKESPVDTLLVIFGPDLSVKSAVSELQHIDGKFGRVSIELTYRLSSNCPKDFYSRKCSISCKLPDNSPGKYTCDYLGQLVCFGNRVWPECTKCRPGYYGPDCSLHSGNEKDAAQEYMKELSPLEYTNRPSRIAQRQVDNDNSTDDSGLSSGQIGGIAGGIGTLYVIYLGIGIGLYFYFFLEFAFDTYFDCLGTVLVALVLFAPYILFITLLFPFFVLLLICLGAVCALGNNN